MSYEGRQFLESCGATGPLRFELAGPTAGDSCNWEIKRAAFVAGRDPAADLILDDPGVAPFQAFFQVVDGWLFGFDLTAGDGLRWGEIPRAAGWVKRGQKLRIGQHTIRLVGGDREPSESTVEPAPTSTRYANRLNLPRVVLEFRHAGAGKDGPYKRDVLDRVLVLAGSSERCKLRVDGNDVAQFACALLRTPSGLWMTNIQPGQGARINGALCRFARIEDDDKIQLGPFNIRVIYNENSKNPVVRASHRQPGANLELSNQRRAVGALDNPIDDLSPELLLQPFLEQTAGDFGLPSSPFGQALVMMMRLLGDVHRDHLALVREELAEIRRLSREMDKLRGEAQQPMKRKLPAPRLEIANGTNHVADAGPRLAIEETRRVHPQAVSEVIAERLEAWERERQSRWRKLLGLLTKP